MRPRRVSDEQILEAARMCLLQHGAAVSVNAIAQCVGVTGPAVLKRFGSKGRLVSCALLSDTPPDLSGGPKPGRLRPQLIAILTEAEKLVGNAAPRLATLRASGVRASRVAENAHPRLARQSLLKWLKKARTTHGLVHPDLESAADLLLSLVEAHAFVAWVDPDWSEPLRAWATRAVEVVFPDLDPTTRGAPSKLRGPQSARKKQTRR